MRRSLTAEERDWAERLRAVWQSKKASLQLTQAIAADEMGVTQGAVGQYLNGKIPLNDSAAMKFAKLLGVPVASFKPQMAKDFRGIWEVRESTPEYDASRIIHEDSTKHRESRRAPIISRISAGDWCEAVDPYAPGVAEAWETVPHTTCPNAFWLRVKGDSMTSPSGVSIPEGYLILVEPSVQPENGSLVVAKLEDENEVTFKKLVIDGPHKYLKPLNPEYKVLQINGNCRIVGTVTQAKMKLN